MMHRNQNNKRLKQYFKVTALCVSMLSVYQSAFALQTLDDHDLRRIDGQDGIEADIQYSQIDIERLYWEDMAGQVTNVEIPIRANFNNVKISPIGIDYPLGTTYQVNVGANGTKSGIDLNVESRPGQIEAGNISLCYNNNSECNTLADGFAIQSRVVTAGGVVQPNLVAHLTTTDGLFNADADAALKLSLNNLNLYVTQGNDQLIAKDFNFNFDATGRMYIDATGGLILTNGTNGYSDLDRVADPSYPSYTKSGFNLELMHKANATSEVYDLTNAIGLIRVGASGRTVGGLIQLRGIKDDTPNTTNILGVADNASTGGGNTVAGSLAGSTGLGMRIKTEFTNADNLVGGTEASLELGHSGDNAYGMRFSNLKPLQVRTSASDLNSSQPHTSARAILDTGNIYLNLVRSDLFYLPMQNTVLDNLSLGGTSRKMMQGSEYRNQTPRTGGYPGDWGKDSVDRAALMLAIRDMEFQAVSRRGQFFSSNDLVGTANEPTGQANNSWGLGLPIHNLDANLALYGRTVPTGHLYAGQNALGLSLLMSTQGVNGDGSKSTSIMVVDGAPNTNDIVGGSAQPTSYYFGLRNIDMVLNTFYNGYIHLADDRMRIAVPRMIAAVSAQMAAGYLPGAKFKTCPTSGSCYSPVNSFTTKNDVLFSMKIRLDGEFLIDLIPGGTALDNNYLNFNGSFTATNNLNSIQVVDEVDGSILGLDTITGRANFDNYIKINKDSVTLNTTLKINPTENRLKGGTYSDRESNVLKISNVNLYPPTAVNGTAQKLGEMVLTGGSLTSRLTLTPFN